MIDEKKLLEALKIREEAHKADYEAFEDLPEAQTIVAHCLQELDEIREIINDQPVIECGDCEAVMNLKAALYDKGVNDGWIPFEEREADEEEKDIYGVDYILCGSLPEEDEEILVTYKNGAERYVCMDIFCREGSECYLDSGAELVKRAIAWQPLPEPYKEVEQ